MTILFFVIPAKAGIHPQIKHSAIFFEWIPAFAGMTELFIQQSLATTMLFITYASLVQFVLLA